MSPLPGRTGRTPVMERHSFRLGTVTMGRDPRWRVNKILDIDSVC